MKTILATAYDINPYKGSESGTGWNFALQISRFNKVKVVTRKNNRDNIERYITEFNINQDNLEFLYYDLPYLLRFWKRGSRGSFLYYNLWQMCLPIFVLKRKVKFDISHHINFHADHVPSFLWILGKPLFWGPINHNELIPREFLHSKKDLIIDRLKFFIKWVRWNLDPFLFLCKRKATVVIGSHNSVMSRLNIKQKKFRVVSTISAQFPRCRPVKSMKKFSVISVGRHVSIKSFDVSIRAFDYFYSSLSDIQKSNVEFLLVGKGPLFQSLSLLANSLESKQAIKFIPWLEKEELDKIYLSASVMLAPSHEGGGAVVAESLSFGIPVVCFENSGAGSIVDNLSGLKFECGPYEKSYKKMGEGLYSLFQDRKYLSKLSDGAIKNSEANLSWDRKGDQILDIYNEFLN